MSRNRREGTVYQRDSDSRWVATLLFEDRPAKPIYGRTKAEALKKRAKAIKEDDTGRVGEWSRKTVKAYLAHWLTDIKGPHGSSPVRPQTFAGYSIQLGHILPHIGHYKLESLTTAHVEQGMIALARAGISPQLRKLIHSRLTTAFKHAVDRDYIRRSPMDRLRLPKVPTREQRVLTRDEVRRIVEAIRGDDNEALWHVFLQCGGRNGEVRALTWDDIDEAAGVIHITKTLVRLPGNETIGPPKSQAGVRDVTLTPDLAAMLRAHKRRIRQTPAWRHPELVFPSIHGTYLNSSVLLGMWHQVLEKASVERVRVHDIRHTWATLAMEEGADFMMLQKAAGWSRGGTQMAQHYLHARDDRERDVMTRIARALAPETEGEE